MYDQRNVCLPEKKIPLTRKNKPEVNRGNFNLVEDVSGNFFLVEAGLKNLKFCVFVVFLAAVIFPAKFVVIYFCKMRMLLPTST